MRVMMILGMFVFSVPTASFDSLRRTVGWRHPATARVGVRSAHQFLGVDEETIALSGAIWGEIAPLGRVSLEVLESMANDGKAYLLIGGDFKIYGRYVIESMETTRMHLFPNGAARKIEFSLTLKRVDPPSGLIMGLLSAVAGKVAATLL